jgi:hypothetical protein
MRWQRGPMDEYDAMVMGGQQHAEHWQVLCHPFKSTINLCRQFREEKTRDRDSLGGGAEKGRGGGGGD